MSSQIHEEDSAMSLEISEEEQASSSRMQDADSPPLGPFTVFLSHSGQEKPFARKLYKALKLKGLSVFFDENSLPFGEPFPGPIILAAENCRVALVVLSGGFLSSKWPMLEAEIFQASRKSNNRGMKIFPLFFKVSSSGLKNEEELAIWFGAWRKAVKDDHTSREEQRKKWEGIVKGLAKNRGLEFWKFSNDEEEFIKEVVQEICKVSLPLAKFDDSEIEGKERLVQEVMQHFECDTTEGSTSLGIYGIGGAGKSTLCRLLCNDHAKQFGRKVFYLELDEGRNLTKDQLSDSLLKRQKRILGRLCEKKFEDLRDIEDPRQGWAVLKQKMPYHDVFLVLDNVWESSLEEAKEYMKVRYSKRSRVLVMSRDKSVLEKVFLARDTRCMAMPDLRKGEAVAVFLQAASIDKSSLNGNQLSVVERCVKRCDFPKRSNAAESSKTTASLYHPLSLRVLGASLREQGKDPSTWRIELSKWFEGENPVFSVIGKSYEDLPVRTKQVFLDLAVFLQPEFRAGSAFVRDLDDLDDREEWNPSGMKVNEILRRLHGKDSAKEVQKLRDRLILDSHGMMHDLFEEFARMMARTGEFGDPQSRCIYRRYSDAFSESTDPTKSRLILYRRSPSEFSGPSVEKVASVRRVDICDIQISDPLPELQKYSQVEVLKLKDCQGLKRLDVGAMKNLIYLEIMSRFMNSVEVSGMGSLQKLAWCRLEWCRLEKMSGDTRLPPAHVPLKLPNLRVWSIGCSGSDQYRGQLPDWRESPHLMQLHVHLAFPGLYLSVQHERLEELHLGGNDSSIAKIVLRGLPNLRVLELYCFDNLRELVGLGNLISLTLLVVSSCSRVRDLAGLEALTAPLRKLYIGSLKIMQRLPDLGHLTALVDLEIRFCDLVTEVLGLNKLANLRNLSIIGSRVPTIFSLPDVSELTKLRTLELDESVESMPGLEQIAGGLTSLTCSGRLLTTQVVTKLSATLTVCGAAPRFEQLASGLFSDVTDLSFEDCPDLTSLDYLQDLFPRLQMLSIESCPLPQLPCKLPSTIESLKLYQLGITSLPPALFAANSRLSLLKFSECEQLSARELMTLWQSAHVKPKGFVSNIFQLEEFGNFAEEQRQWEQVSSELSSIEISSFLMAVVDEEPHRMEEIIMKCVVSQEPSLPRLSGVTPSVNSSLASLCLPTSVSTTDLPLPINKRTMTAVCENPELLTKVFKSSAASILSRALASGEYEELQMSYLPQLLQLLPAPTSDDGLRFLEGWCTILHSVLTHHPNLREKLKAEGILNVLRCRLQDVTTELHELDLDEDAWVSYGFAPSRRYESVLKDQHKWLGKCIIAVS